MTDFGLSDEITAKIQQVFKNYPKVEQAKIFGSRAKGNYRENSDIDIVVFGDLDLQKLGQILLDLEELPTAHSFDLKLYNKINHPKLKNHIDRVAKVFYVK